MNLILLIPYVIAFGSYNRF